MAVRGEDYIQVLDGSTYKQTRRIQVGDCFETRLLGAWPSHCLWHMQQAALHHTHTDTQDPHTSIGPKLHAQQHTLHGTQLRQHTSLLCPIHCRCPMVPE